MNVTTKHICDLCGDEVGSTLYIVATKNGVRDLCKTCYTRLKGDYYVGTKLVCKNENPPLFKCSVCGFEYDPPKKPNYCPNCGCFAWSREDPWDI